MLPLIFCIEHLGDSKASSLLCHLLIKTILLLLTLLCTLATYRHHSQAELFTTGTNMASCHSCSIPPSFTGFAWKLVLKSTVKLQFPLPPECGPFDNLGCSQAGGLLCFGGACIFSVADISSNVYTFNTFLLVLLYQNDNFRFYIPVSICWLLASKPCLWTLSSLSSLTRPFSLYFQLFLAPGLSLKLNYSLYLFL